MPARPRLVIDPDTLRRRRLEAVLTRAQLAHLAGISRRRIEQIESGIATTTTPDTARALASALGCPVNELVEVVDGDE